MGLTRSQIDVALQELYDQVPRIPSCDGRCWISCGPIDMIDRERARIREAGYRITPAADAVLQADTFWCEALTEDRRCAVYGIRPLICRVWGTTERLRCPYGCIPEDGWLTDEEFADLLVEADKLGGNKLPLRVRSEPDPDAMALLDAVTSGGMELREQYNIPLAFRPKKEEFPCPSCGFMLTRPPDGVRIGRCAHCRQIVPLDLSLAPPAC